MWMDDSLAQILAQWLLNAVWPFFEWDTKQTLWISIALSRPPCSSLCVRVQASCRAGTHTFHTLSRTFVGWTHMDPRP